jgi:protein-S-isoprenylcysteine O-methyltransferase Ste14
MWKLLLEAALFVIGGLNEQFVKYRLAKAPLFQGAFGYRLGLFLELIGYAPMAVFTIWSAVSKHEVVMRSRWGMVLGALLLLVGLAINYIAVRELKLARWNSAPLYGVERELNSLVDSGIYGLVRHPSYVGQIIMFAGCAFLYPSQYVVTFAITFALYAVLLHTRIEDHYLVERLGTNYVGYARRVPPFIPAWQALWPARERQDRV